jgi:hypothetical protein
VRAQLLLASLLLSSLCWPLLAHAQSAEVSLSASASRVQVGEPFAVEIRASIDGGEADDVQVPDFGALQVLGRRVSRPFSFSFGFGGSQHAVMKSEVVYSFTLRALEPGTYRIAPAVVQVGRRKFSSKPLNIEATGAALPAGSQGLSDDPTDLHTAEPTDTPPDDSLDGARFDPELFVRTVVDQKEPYVGQQVTVTIYVYSRSNFHQFPTLTREATTEGFWVHDLLPMQRTPSFVRADVNGRPFFVYVLRKFAAFPLRPGKLTIGAPVMEWSSGGTLFDMIRPSKPVRRNGVEVSVEARPLPARQGAQRPVHVGTLALEAKLEPVTARVGDALTLTVQARGTGNLKSLELTPSVSGVAAEVLAPEIDDEVTADLDRVGGTRTFRWLVLPRAPGKLEVAPLAIDLLDPETGSYGAAQTAPLSLEVAGSAAPAQATAPSAAGDGEAPHFGPARTESELWRKRAGLHEQGWFWPLVLAAPLLLGLGLLGRTLSRTLLARRAGSGGSRKFREAQQQLDQAQVAAERGDASASLSALAASLKRALEARLGEPVGGLTRGALRGHLAGRGMAPPLADRVVSQLEACELARFDPAGKSKSELGTEIERARGVLRELERFEPREVAP